MELPPDPANRIHCLAPLPDPAAARPARRSTATTFMDELKNAGVGCSVHWRPLHLHPYYAKNSAGGRPTSRRDAHWERLVSLPIFPGMRDDEIEPVIASVAALCLRNRRRPAGASRLDLPGDPAASAVRRLEAAGGGPAACRATSALAVAGRTLRGLARSGRRGWPPRSSSPGAAAVLPTEARRAERPPVLLLKLRTMSGGRRAAGHGREDDPRVTRVGRLLEADKDRRAAAALECREGRNGAGRTEAGSPRIRSRLGLRMAPGPRSAAWNDRPRQPQAPLRGGASGLRAGRPGRVLPAGHGSIQSA